MILGNELGGHNTLRLNRTDSRSFGNLSPAFGNLSGSPQKDEKAELPIRMTKRPTFFWSCQLRSVYHVVRYRC